MNSSLRVLTKDTEKEKITKEEGIRGLCTETLFELHDKITNRKPCLPFVSFSPFVFFV